MNLCQCGHSDASKRPKTAQAADNWRIETHSLPSLAVPCQALNDAVPSLGMPDDPNSRSSVAAARWQDAEAELAAGMGCGSAGALKAELVAVEAFASKPKKSGMFSRRDFFSVRKAPNFGDMRKLWADKDENAQARLEH